MTEKQKAGDKLAEVLKKSHERKQYNFAMHEPAHCLAPLLFSAIQDKKRLEKWKSAWKHPSKDYTVEFSGYQRLNVFDMKVLQALVAIASGVGKTFSVSEQLELSLNNRGPKPEKFVGFKDDGEPDVKPLTDEDIKNVDVQLDAGYVAFTTSEICRYMGIDATQSKNKRYVMDCLDRLSEVNMKLDQCNFDPDYGKSGRLITWTRIVLQRSYNSKTHKHTLWMNNLLARVAFGDILERPQYVKLLLTETQALQGDAAALLHQRLCALVRFGETSRFDLDTLIGYIYKTTKEVKRNAQSNRRKKVREGMEAIGKLEGWTVETSSPTQYKITRHQVAP